ncbi:MAG: tetratricopeptide repeat protein [Bacteroidaceae bacterium]|nr:tetratricopeptide repeat protein [Bacteroidaceae bacterium]
MTSEQQRAQAAALYEQGNAFRKNGQWADALNAYAQATALDAESPAATARQMLTDIMEFRCNDYYNP